MKLRAREVRHTMRLYEREQRILGIAVALALSLAAIIGYVLLTR